jgi:hypothetical protein
VIGDTVDTFKLASSFDNAQAGTAINLTTNGTGIAGDRRHRQHPRRDAAGLRRRHLHGRHRAGHPADRQPRPAHGRWPLPGVEQRRRAAGGAVRSHRLLGRTSTSNSFKLAPTYADAIANTNIVDITDTAAASRRSRTPRLTVRRTALTYADHTFTASASTDKLTSPGTACRRATARSA